MKKSNDSAVPAFWNQRYASAETPWVLHKVPATLLSFLKRTRTRGRVLIPGCGTDHGVIKAFADAGFKVTAIDFSPVALAETKKALGNFGPRCEPHGRWTGRIMRADFFKSDFGRRFDLVYERTFLCAMHPRRWSRYAKRVAELLRPGGKLIGIFFYGTDPEPPPYPINKTQAKEIFGKCFRLIRDLKVSDSVPMFAGMERWQEWELANPKPPTKTRKIFIRKRGGSTESRPTKTFPRTLDW
jgi:SAM-dependent methyltransferase